MTRRILMMTALLAALATAVFAADNKTKANQSDSKPGVGISVWHHGLSETADINGGSYLGASLSVFLSDWAVADAGYCTDITPASFHDHLVSMDLLVRIVDAGTFVMALGPIYLGNLAVALEGNYVGAKLLPISSWKTQHKGAVKGTFNLLPISVLYGINSGQVLYAFSLFDMQFFL